MSSQDLLQRTYQEAIRENKELKAKIKSANEYCKKVINNSFEDEIYSDGTQEFLWELQAKRNIAENVLSIIDKENDIK